MIKVFTTNKDGKIELTKEELKALLDEAYWDGYKANDGVYIFKIPYIYDPFKITCNTDSGSCTITLNSDTITGGTISMDSNTINIGGIK